MTAHELLTRGLSWLAGVRASRVVTVLLLAGCVPAVWWAASWNPWLLTAAGLLWIPGGLLLWRLGRYEDAPERRRVRERDGVRS